MNKNIKNLEASIYAKLQNKARQTNRPFSEILQYFGIERFLYRLNQSQYLNNFVLKGALMFIAWEITERRTTLDIDLCGRFDNRVSFVENIVRDICNINVVPDGLIFDPETVKGQKIKEDADYEEVRIKLISFINKTRIPMQIDIGFGDIIYPSPKLIEYPVILDFPNPKLLGYSAESVISEKFEAMIKLGLLNSRMKDFYDIWLMMRQFNFQGAKLIKALAKTFSHRKTSFPSDNVLFAEEIYDETSDRQILWKAFLNKNNLEFVPDKLSIIAKEIEIFLIKPVEAIRKKQDFNYQWDLSGKWK